MRRGPTATAASTSAASAEETRASSSPVAGFTESKVAPERAARYLPSMKISLRGLSSPASRVQSCKVVVTVRCS